MAIRCYPVRRHGQSHRRLRGRHRIRLLGRCSQQRDRSAVAVNICLRFGGQRHDARGGGYLTDYGHRWRPIIKAAAFPSSCKRAPMPAVRRSTAAVPNTYHRALRPRARRLAMQATRSSSLAARPAARSVSSAGGTEYVSSGGRAISATVSSGSLNTSCGTASGTTLNGGHIWFDFGHLCRAVRRSTAAAGPRATLVAVPLARQSMSAEPRSSTPAARPAEHDAQQRQHRVCLLGRHRHTARRSPMAVIRLSSPVGTASGTDVSTVAASAD